MDKYTLYSGFDSIQLSFDFGMINIERKDFNDFVKTKTTRNVKRR